MIRFLVLRILLLFLMTLFVRAESPVLVLEKARQMEVHSDVLPALDLYRRVAANPAHALRWRAEATAGLARCHELTESYVMANTHYLTVIKEFGQFKELADLAGERFLAISRILAEDGGSMSGGDLFFFNELVLSLYGALENEDADLSRDIFLEVEKHLSHLSKVVEGSGDESFVKESAQEVKRVKEASKKGLTEGAAQLLKTEKLGVCVTVGYEDDPGELFNPVMRWKDRMVNFLTENDSVKVNRFAERIEKYLEPLTEGPEGDERKLARHYFGLVQEVMKVLENEEFSKARRIIFESDREKFKGEMTIAVYLEDYDFLPANHLPYLSASSDWVEHALTFWTTKPGEALKSVRKAREVCRELQKIIKDRKFAKENAGYIEMLDEVIEAMAKDDLVKARKILEGEEEAE